MCFYPVPNRLIVKWLAVLSFLLALVCLCVATVVGRAEQSQLFPPFKTARNGLVALCVLRMIVALAGVAGGSLRNKCQTLVFLVCTPVLLVAHLGVGAQLYKYVEKGSLVDQFSQSEFRDAWIVLVDEAVSDSAIEDWLGELSSEEQCCGWDDPAEEEQNPDFLDCTYDTGCSERFVDWCQANVGPAVKFQIASGTIELAIWLFLVALVCRRRPGQGRRRAKDDKGDYVPHHHVHAGAEPTLSCMC